MTWPPEETPLVRELNEIIRLAQEAKRDIRLGELPRLHAIRSRLSGLGLAPDSDRKDDA